MQIDVRDSSRYLYNKAEDKYMIITKHKEAVALLENTDYVELTRLDYFERLKPQWST
jgi:hypothetical protein